MQVAEGPTSDPLVTVVELDSAIEVEASKPSLHAPDANQQLGSTSVHDAAADFPMQLSLGSLQFTTHEDSFYASLCVADRRPPPLTTVAATAETCSTEGQGTANGNVHAAVLPDKGVATEAGRPADFQSPMGLSGSSSCSSHPQGSGTTLPAPLHEEHAHARSSVTSLEELLAWRRAQRESHTGSRGKPNSQPPLQKSSIQAMTEASVPRYPVSGSAPRVFHQLRPGSPRSTARAQPIHEGDADTVSSMSAVRSSSDAFSQGSGLSSDAPSLHRRDATAAPSAALIHGCYGVENNTARMRSGDAGSGSHAAAEGEPQTDELPASPGLRFGPLLLKEFVSIFMDSSADLQSRAMAAVAFFLFFFVIGYALFA